MKNWIRKRSPKLMPENKFDLSSINYPEAFLSDRLNDPKIKYSAMTVEDRLMLAMDCYLTFVNEVRDGVYPFYRTNAWYNPFLKVIYDLGYDITDLQISDWNNIEDVIRRFNHVIRDIERRIKGSEIRCYCLEQIVFDC